MHLKLHKNSEPCIIIGFLQSSTNAYCNTRHKYYCTSFFCKAKADFFQMVVVIINVLYLMVKLLFLLKGRGHAKFISINFISIISLKDVLYGMDIYFSKNNVIAVKSGIEKAYFVLLWFLPVCSKTSHVKYVLGDIYMQWPSRARHSYF